jgi:outer membrane protein OmpA-like peptidoglycan-associated protein
MSSLLQKSLLILLAVAPLLSTGQPIPTFEEDPENLGPGVNSEYDEVNPVITPDGAGLYINRKNHPDNTNGDDNDDIWFATRIDKNKWGKASNAGPPLNNGNHNFVSAVTPDGHQLLVANLYRPNGLSGPGASISYRTFKGWGFPVGQQIDSFVNRARFVEFYMANNAQVLLMAIDDGRSLGNRDLYVSFRKGPNKWTRPKNLGKQINTSQQEASPFLASDQRTLYFSSSGWNSRGSLDIFMTRRLDDSWTKWSTPVNLGPKVNGAGFDAYFTIPATGEYGYFASSKNALGGTDIFRIKLPPSLRPEPVFLLSGRVTNKVDNLPIEANIYYEDLETGEQVGRARSNPINGTYRLVLPLGKHYGLRAAAKGFYSINESFDLRSEEAFQQVERDLVLVPLVKGEVIRLNNLFFASGSATLQSASLPELDRLVNMLRLEKDLKIEIAGHTDQVGSDKSNQKLSEDRVAAVIKYLTENGIRQDRLTGQGYGESEPIESNETAKGRSQNRRVEFRIL